MFEVNYKDDAGRWQDSPVYAVDKKNSRFYSSMITDGFSGHGLVNAA